MESSPLRVYYVVSKCCLLCSCSVHLLYFIIVLILQVRVYLTQSYPAEVDHINRLCLLDIIYSRLLHEFIIIIIIHFTTIAVNLTTTVEDIVWQNLGAVIIAHWSLPLNTTASSDPATLKYQLQIDTGDNTSSHSNPQEFSQVGNEPYGLH